MVKQLRDTTQAGFADCKKAVEETNGNFEEALDWLKKRGIAKASKKSGAIAADGTIVIVNDENSATIAEINSQTDFVAISDNFQSAANKIALALQKNGNKTKDLESALKLKVDGKTISEYTTELTGTIGEKIELRRFNFVEKSKNQAIATYLHANKRIGVVIVLEGTNDSNLAKDIAMHAAAMKPQYVSMNDVPQNVVDKERAIILEQMASDPANKSKPKNILEKMSEGKVKKALKDMVIEEQTFVKDSKKTISQLLKENKSSISEMIRYEVGEGIEVAKVDFKEEVKKQIG
ncbi:MAG: elongation factor Ts [Mycoplasmataceae bacterium]|nr:elongation factor Ts [Mycoplasmataceae bacterium]